LGPALLSSRDVVVQPQADVPAIDEIRFSAPRPNGAPAAATMTELHEILLHSSRANAVEITRPARKRWPFIAGASAALAVIVAAAMIFAFNRATVPSAKPAGAPASTTTTIQQPEDAAPTRAHSTLTVPASTPAAVHRLRGAESVKEAARRPVQEDTGPSREQAQMMDDQLHTPTRLQMKTTPAEQATPPPGGFAAADIDGSDNSNAIGSAFGSPKPPRVQIAPQQVVNLPSGVASGLLIQKTQPVYPSIAKTGQVSGTIVLAATISKTGNVENLRVVSGPFMLRMPAVNAVRTWRFKPYILYDQPTAFETTINVHFCGQQDPCARDRQ
jgi:protein TonB